MMSDRFITDDIDVVDIANTFAEELKARSGEFEEQGFVSQDLVDRLAELGMYRLCNPKTYGGLGRSPLEYATLVERLAEFDAATGWVVFIGITSALSMTNLEMDVVSKMMADSLAITAGVFAPLGRASRCEANGVKGFRLTGQWQWGSGSKNAAFISGGGFVVDDSGERLKLENGLPDQRSFFMPIEDVEILDTWHVSGLKGTGSADFKVDGVFVPESMTFGAFRKNTGHGP
ncbi:MAG: alkylation response protein AidB-like acyl-CoA dehydrogenase, partial [Candidatus Azotimanducaceae bacterium]